MSTRPEYEEEAIVERDDSPPDHPVLLDEYGVTGAEEAHAESLSARLRREVPERARDHEEEDELVPAEEAAVHVVVPAPPRRRRPHAPDPSMAERLELAEAEIASLLAASQTLLDALDLLLQGMEPLPTEEPHERARRTATAARHARELLVAARSRPAD